MPVAASLVAVHNAKNAIWAGDCEMAIVAGVRIVFAPLDSQSNRIGIESSDGNTRTFDDNADGTGFGEGSGAVILKPLDKALEDHDQIYAIIKGSYVNHDGYKEGITNPDSLSQSRLLNSAWQNAGIDPLSISYIEAHGTATRVGDPVEAEGIRLAFEKYTNNKNFCAVGTVKANIGHLFEGSGVMGLIKAALMLKHKQIPPLANYKVPNKKIDFKDSPLYIPTKLKDWKINADIPRRCGVSAFGLGGTNCHVVLEEAPVVVSEDQSSLNFVFTLSAESKKSLSLLVNKYIEFINSNKDNLSFKNFCYTSNISRSHYRYKLALISKSFDNLVLALEAIRNKSNANLNNSLVFSNIASELMPDLHNVDFISDDDKLNSLIMYCQNYIHNTNVDFSKLYSKEDVHTITLPSYIFDEIESWVEFPENYLLNFINNESAIEDNTKMHQIIFTKVENSYILPNKFKMLVLTNANQQNTLSLKLKQNENIDLITLERSDGKQIFELDDSEMENEYKNLAKKISDNGYTHFVHALALEKEPSSSLDDINRREKKNLISLFLLTKNLILLGVKINLVVISNNSVFVDSNDNNLISENSILAGFVKVISREYPYITSKLIDIDEVSNNESLLNEIISEDSGVLGLRRNNKYKETFTELSQSDDMIKNDKKNYIKSGGNYLITGGAGAIGQEVCRLFAGLNQNVNLFLISRTEIPARDQWDNLLTNSDKKTKERIAAFKELESNGTNLHFFVGDVTDEKRMNEIYGSIKNDFGRIDGIVHAAGVPGKNLIQFRALKDFESVVKPKLQGTYIINQLIKDDKPDFIVYFSSVATVFPSSGQADYSAGNFYLDTLASSNKDQNCHIISFDWVAWKEIGMAVDYGTNDDTTFKALPTKTGIEIIDFGLRSNYNRIFGGEVNYESSLVQILKTFNLKLSEIISTKIAKALAKLEQETVNASEKLKKNIEDIEISILGKEDNNYSPYEIIVAKSWAFAFGYSEINIFDDFYNIGGDSITAITISNNLATYFDVPLGSADFLSLSDMSVFETAKLIENMVLDSKVEKNIA